MIIHRAEEGGYWAEFPTLPGCFVQGETIDELLAEAPELMESYMEALRDAGQAIPEENVMIATVRVPDEAVAS